MILQELLAILESQALLEDLGNLRVIDRDLVRAFFHVSPSFKERGLEQKLGRNSKVEKKVISSTHDMTDILRGPIEDGTNYHHKNERAGYHIVGAVLIHDGKQILSFCDNHFAGKPRDHGSSTTMFQVMAKKEARDLIPEDVRKAKYIHFDWTIDQNRIEPKDIHSLETILTELLKASGGKMEALVISFDFDRLKTHQQRESARYGMTYLPTGDTATEAQRGVYRNFLHGLKYKLQERLEKYKKDKAPNSDNGPDLVRQMKDKGFPEFIKFMGYTYEKSTVNVNWNDLEEVAKGKKKSNDTWVNNYITYRITWDSPGYKQLMRDMEDIMDELPKKGEEDLSEKAWNNVWESFEERYHKQVPPKEIKVIIALKGGMTYPADVVLKHNEINRQ